MTSRLHRLALFWQRFTPAQSSHEQLLWWWLRLLWFPPWQVKRQVEVGPYKIDLAIMNRPLKVAVEVDGWIWHKNRGQKDADRTDYLKQRGWIVQRYDAEDTVELIPFATAWHAACLARARLRQLRGGLDLSLLLWWVLIGIGCLGWVFFLVWIF